MGKTPTTTDEERNIQKIWVNTEKELKKKDPNHIQECVWIEKDSTPEQFADLVIKQAKETR
jgi:hypothetical protein